MNSSKTSKSKKSSNYTEIDSKFECPICQCVMTHPYEINSCSHTFCKNCVFSLFEYSKNSTSQCPLCKINFTQKDLKENKNLTNEIKSGSHTCICNQDIKLVDWNDHISKCKFFTENITENIKQRVVKESKVSKVNRSTFGCPLCTSANLDREGLINHVQKFHKNAQAVCPICVAQPWGDPNYVTGIYGHLLKRHKFDYDTTVDYQEDEDEVLKRVLLESMITK